MTALSKLRSTGLSVLTCEKVDANGYHCAECGDPADSNGHLLAYATVIGNRTRLHDGMFCSKECHDRFHGLAPRRR